ncbi:MAG: hypothetical protein R3F59_08215 [Myxococcota bacterium]
MSHRANPVLLATTLALAACGTEAGSPELLLPQEVHVAWEGAYNGVDDGLGALVPVDVMAYDGATGEPLGDVPVEVYTDDAAAVPVPVEAVLVVNAQDEPAVDPEDQLAELGLLGPADGPPYGEADEPEPRRIAWDAVRDQYVVFDAFEADSFESNGGGIELLTDSGGVARLYLYVDAFPETEIGFQPVRVVVSMGDVDELFTVSPR